MPGQRNFKPRHRQGKGFVPRELNLERNRRQQLYRGDDTWRKFSRKFLEVNKNCYCCGDKSQVTDHLVAHKGDRDLFEKTGNHIALCFTCHNTVTGKFDSRYKAGESIENKTIWMNTERAKNEILQNRKFPPVKVINYRDK